MSEERRQYERLAKKYRVEVKKFCFPLSAGGAKEVSCLNISAGGLLLESAEKFECDAPKFHRQNFLYNF